MNVNFLIHIATLLHWLHVESFVCRILIRIIRMYLYVPIRDIKLNDYTLFAQRNVFDAGGK